MSRYVVRIPGGYLCRGRVVRKENATYYPHPSAASDALQHFQKFGSVPPHARMLSHILDTRTGRRFI